MRKMLLITLSVLFFATSAFSLEIAGVNLPEMMKDGKTRLMLNGAGVRTKWGLKIYAGGLYLKHKTKDAKKIIDEDKPMAIKLHMVSGLITSEKMINAVHEGFENSTNGNPASIQAKIDKFIGVFKEEIKENDIYDLIYIPGKGTVIKKNGQEKGVIEGMDFKQPLFAIWLGDKPAHKGLKKGMLGL